MGGAFLPKRRNFRFPVASMVQPSIQRWKERRRRQRIFGVVIVIVLVAVLLYGWLRVFSKL
jgi:type VI protein secretion system component VasK